MANKKNNLVRFTFDLKINTSFIELGAKVIKKPLPSDKTKSSLVLEMVVQKDER